MKRIFQLVFLMWGVAVLPMLAQEAVPPPMPEYQPLSGQQLDQLLGPIALYPDPLIALILPASTLPTQLVLADRYLLNGGDPNTIDQQPWDGSVQGLAHYPMVLKWMDDNLGWTTELGQAFLNQQADVMASIQRLRAQALSLGNLQSTPQQQVVDVAGTIEILPVNPTIIYVPVYQPEVVYVQSGFFLGFGVGYPIGWWLNCDLDWRRHHLVIWDHDHPRPPNWWHERPDQRDNFLRRQGRAGEIWRPEDHRDHRLFNQGDRGWGNAPGDHSRVLLQNRPPASQPPPRMGTPVAPRGNEPRQPLSPVRPQPVVPVSRPPVMPARPKPAPVIRQNEPARWSAPNSAFIGIQSPQQTRIYSNRGQESRMTISEPSRPSAPPPAPVVRPAPSGGGGGGGQGQQPRR